MKNFGWNKAGFILLFAVGLSVLTVIEAFATHLRAGQITVKRLVNRRVIVTVTVFTDTNCSDCILFGGTLDILDFGDNTSVLIPETPNRPLTPAVSGVGWASYSVEHIYGSNGRYTISYLEPNRNEGVLNMDNSVETTFYLETQIDLSVSGDSNSPTMKIPPIDVGCVGVAFSHNSGAVDVDGDSLSYELVQPFRERNTPVQNYRDPNVPEFYSGDYNTKNEAGNGPPTFAIDSIDGTLKWDAPGKKGEYNVAFVVKEWRRIQGVWRNIGFVRRDMQIIVEDCNNERPTLEIPDDLCVVAGTVIDETIIGRDVDGTQVYIQAFSEIFEEFGGSWTPDAYQPIGSDGAKLFFHWATKCEHVKDQDYQVVFKITDQPLMGPRLVTFETWRIKVVGPAPVLETAVPLLPARKVKLDWEPYECADAASKMQIWRRVASTNFVPDECEMGMPESLGFTLIAQIDMVNGVGDPVTTYTDQSVEANTQYCYRLVATFPQGGESYVSIEKCIEPILTSQPVITKVSVQKTGDADGEIRVEWRSPLAPTSFSKPYKYQLERETSPGEFEPVSPIMLDTFYTHVGLDTYDDVYAYRVVLFDNAEVAADVSTVAGSVWLDLNPEKGKIQLNWNADVPWSIQLQDRPYHVIYRGFEGDDESEMVFLDSVDVLESGLIYEDDTLDSNLTYCYRVETRGGYGNPRIGQPLINFSQINCAVPSDSLPPCTPVVKSFGNKCAESLGCDSKFFENRVEWTAVCDDEIRRYNVYITPDRNGSSKPDTTVRDPLFIDKNLPTRAYCYRITAVDRSNNESAMSALVCNDNCPNYELPNVFSPNGDGCNDLFRAFGDQLDDGEATSSCEEADPSRCARFVRKVDFTVYNRWGRKVYSYVGQQGDENSIYIRWNGKDESGNDLAAGIYYYAAEVTFDLINPKDRSKIVKGWVHLVR